MTRTVTVPFGDTTREISAPDHWSDRAVQIAGTKYLLDNEQSIGQWLYRIADTIAANTPNADAMFAGRLFEHMRSQRATFNTPVHMNVGREDKPQCWACLIYGVGDHMQGPGGIEEWVTVEAETFRNGSGSGVTVDAIREDGARLRGSKYGVASGPLSFMRITDAAAGAITSGGRTRRAAKMVIIGDRHPDLMAFIEAKAKEERVSRALQAAGFDVTMNGDERFNLQFQNANNSVRVSPEFMQAVRDDWDWELTSRLDGYPVKVLPAKQIWQAISQAAWECADPGVQYDAAIQKWHTCKNDGPIRASNPCSEYLFLDNTCCNLASIRLTQFLTDGGPSLWDFDAFELVVSDFITAMDALVDLSSYPTPEISERNPEYRTLGLGYTDLGALLMTQGMSYDSDAGRALAGAVAALMQGLAYRRSAQLARDLGPYKRYEANKESHLAVLGMHRSAVEVLFHEITAPDDVVLGMPAQIIARAREVWGEALFLAASYGLRNAQVSVIAPTGTISFVLDAETTGIEPYMAIPGVGGVTMTKELAGGGDMQWDAIPPSVRVCVEKFYEHKVFWGDAVFATANGHLPLSPESHVRMMAAVQPFISGGISKTANMPASATVEDVQHVYQLAYDLGVKSVAIYRDGSKAFQPVTVKREEQDGTPVAVATVDYPQEHSHLSAKLPGTRFAVTHKFALGDDNTFYLTAGFYDAQYTQLGEVFLRGSKMGSLSAGFADVWAIAISMDLQHGRPFAELRDKFRFQQFEPSGIAVSDCPVIHFASSVPDYVMHWLDWFINDGGRQQLLGAPAEITYTLPIYPHVVTVGTTVYNNDRRNGPEQAYMTAGATRVSGMECPACHRLSLAMVGTCHMCTDASCLYKDGGCE